MTTRTGVPRPAGSRTRTRLATTATMAMLALAACGDFDVTNTNAPTVETLTGAPTRLIMARAATGIFAQTFNDIGTEIQFYALYGREGYNLLGNDPRETGEQIRGPADPTGRHSGIWTGPYAAIRTINTYLEALPRTSGLSEPETRASQGFAKTMKAWHIHRLAVRTGQLGIPLDVDRPISADPAPFVSFAAAMEAASSLMDEALADLNAAGSTAFPFTMAPGYTGFATPATFTRFNRALAAKILVHRATFVGCGTCWTEASTAMNASFVTTAGLPGSLATGVVFSYSASANEPANPVSEPLTNNRLWVHPSLLSGVQLKPNNEPDDRLTRKVAPAGRTRNLNDLVGTHKLILYNSASNPAAANLGAPIPWINNEELLLLRAEIRWNTNDRQGALNDLNLVRLHSGGLGPTTLTIGSSNDAFVTELLYNRLYSLMWAQGTRWIDARRYGRTQQLPQDRAGDTRYENMIVPVGECTSRGLEAPCTPL
ncbi:MAG TPA: RagB/SusD family nutrient uptake outer membrane protein [Gemmatimonadales bacterium]|nr:RagB/SusD family nutrient uptake outer membrane protein [Gemmatimonadales bacterium]